MKYLNINPADLGAESGEDAGASRAALEARLQAQQERLREPSVQRDERASGRLLLEMGRVLLALDRREEAWEHGREAFRRFAALEDWEAAVEACDVLFQTEQPSSLSALGQGIWLSMTYPIDPELTVAMLEHVVEETPDDSDGAAVAAAAACYIVHLRSQGKQRENLTFYTNQLLGAVARRHSHVETQEAFDAWVERLELHDPERFLPRLRNVVDVLVQDDWWIDREALVAKLPVD